MKIVSALVVLAMSVAAAAADELYPARPITIIVPFASGGGSDILARIVSKQLERVWKVPVVVENKAGAGGITGALAAVRAAPDGYTLLLTGMTTLTANVALYKKLPYNPTDFLPLAMAARTPFVLVVNSNLPAQNVREFVQFLKGRSVPLNYATTGPGAPHHLFMEFFISLAGVKLVPVPYKGTAPALNDVIAGHVPAMLADLGPTIEHIRSGRLRALGVSTAQRVLEISEVPTIGESIPGFDVASWQVFTVPAGTPRLQVQKLHNELKGILTAKEVSQSISSLGMIPMATGSVEEMQSFIKTQTELWGDIVRKAGIEGML